jgi:hypothetical protein
MSCLPLFLLSVTVDHLPQLPSVFVVRLPQFMIVIVDRLP